MTPGLEDGTPPARLGRMAGRAWADRYGRPVGDQGAGPAPVASASRSTRHERGVGCLLDRALAVSRRTYCHYVPRHRASPARPGRPGLAPSASASRSTRHERCVRCLSTGPCGVPAHVLPERCAPSSSGRGTPVPRPHADRPEVRPLSEALAPGPGSQTWLNFAPGCARCARRVVPDRHFPRRIAIARRYAST